MHRIPPALAPVLFVPGLFYEALVRGRNALYDTGLLPQHRLPGPVISVGNITMGGTGKTPLVVCIAQMLALRGFRPVILTRGYKRSRSSGILIVSPEETIPSAARILGDESAVIRRHIPAAWMGISKNRFAAGSRISQHVPQPIFILDDGFQHRKLRRDLDIVILDCSRPLQSDGVFPRGMLREPLRGLSRCHIAVLNGGPSVNMGNPVADAVARYSPKAALFSCSQKISALLPFAAWIERHSAEQYRQPRSAFLVAAVGNPGRLEQDVRQIGTEVTGTRFFPDHYRLTPEEWQSCANDARRRNAEAVLTTEKDAIKISHSPDFPLVVAVQSTAIDNAAAFDAMLENCVKKRLSEPAGSPGN